MKRHIVNFIIFTSISVSLCAKSPSDSLLMALDKAIAESGRYEKQKTDRIQLIKDELNNPRISEADRYRVHSRLFQEYESYNCDSARYYVDRNLDIAQRTGNPDWMNESLIRKANILAFTGLYSEAIDLLRKVDQQRLHDDKLAEYYTSLQNIYLYRAEYVSGDEYMYVYLDSMNVYRDLTLHYLPESSYEYTIVMVPRLIDQQRLEDAERMLLTYLGNRQSGTRDYSVLTSILAFVYECSGDPQQRKIYLLKSAISDIQAVVKENNSLRALAELLYEEGHIARADHYMKISMEDANFFNARLRNIQASKMLPIIDSAYQKQKEAQRKELQVLLLIISILSVFLLVAVVYVILQIRKVARARRRVIEVNKELKHLNHELTEANNQQRLTNHTLTEANHIKEEYIGRFLGLCSAYIDKLEAYRRMLNKKAASGKVEELYKTLKSNQFIEDELKEFYENFDSSFLSIFPDFVDRFNTLLPATERIVPKQDEHLTTELRIFALIRLGINDSQKIAGFLRYSITTIYTYRSKLRNKSLYKETFEEEVMKIGSFGAD
ncbi:DUF6377 domain-containing protein [Bacteroides sp. 51]|uniref:DUF6377 domain-containing protein n=1 Tax=Bacteroides sp. 51 TaxID=2302938 RepID=UPI0013D6D17B|nr:DUF6377 domain-containing protein [Bacteroides sp. 51]NDV81638.1 hypothetical protein [Bacteroides sp. 51]